MGPCSTHRTLKLDCLLCRSALPVTLQLYLVLDNYSSDHSIRDVEYVFFNKEEAEAFVRKANYPFLKVIEFGFNSQSGEVY